MEMGGPPRAAVTPAGPRVWKWKQFVFGLIFFVSQHPCRLFPKFLILTDMYLILCSRLSPKHLHMIMYLTLMVTSWYHPILQMRTLRPRKVTGPKSHNWQGPEVIQKQVSLTLKSVLLTLERPCLAWLLEGGPQSCSLFLPNPTNPL